MTIKLSEKLNLLADDARQQFDLFVKKVSKPETLSRVLSDSRRLKGDIYVSRLGVYRLFYTQETTPTGESIMLMLDIIHQGDPNYIGSIPTGKIRS